MDYLDGTLPLAQRMSFKLHISLCPDCRRYIDSYKKTIEIGRAAHDTPEIADPPEELVQAILKSRKS
jgi:anti-sigma factor RsiW